MTAPLLAQNAGETPPRDQGAWQMFIVLGMGLVFFYFILWRPEQKRRKIDDQRGQMKKGDLVTAMGIIGTVVRVNDQTVILRMVDGAKIEFLKAAITDVRAGTEEDVKKAEKEDN